MSAVADALVARLPRITLVVGKGGVGKTTAAAALALHSSRRIGPTLVVTTDPARALPAVLGHPPGSESTPVRYAPRLTARSLDAQALRARFMDRWSRVIRVILDRGTYLDDSDIGPLVDTALPGGDEIFSALALAELIAAPPSARGAPERIVVDTAPTGHTLRLLNLPATFRALVRLLDAMQAKHRYMVSALTRRYRRDEADAFLEEMTALVSALEQALVDRGQCAAVMVLRPDALVRDESERFLGSLQSLGIHVDTVIWNATDEPQAPLGGAPQLVVPTLKRYPAGEAGLDDWLARLHVVGEGRPGTSRAPAREAKGARRVAADPLTVLRPLTIVAGKGGVGKTTVAAALAIRSADTHRTLVVSTDPAPSLADALARSIPDQDTPVGGVPGLFARQMDASDAFARLRDEYQSRVDALFAGLLPGGMDLGHDRAVARDLLSLAPPGVDEVYALSLISDALFKDRFERVVVDPAPTGHLLRLLEMPQLALAWCHQILRLMLKYKEVAGLGETAAEILEFSRNLRAVDALLGDAARAGVLIVALDEPVVIEETERLAAEVASRRVAITGVLVNRAGRRATLPVRDAPVHLEAPAVSPPPVGPEALLRWSRSWVNHDPNDDA